MAKLTFFKCNDCLTSFTSLVKVDLCACGGKVECMGTVKGDKYIRTEERCACDKRCTHALGPSCDCVCGGENHGTGRVVEIVIESGVARSASVDNVALGRAAEFRRTRDDALRAYKQRWGSVDEAKQRGEFIPKDTWLAWRKAQEALETACKGKVHSNRIKQLVKLARESSAT